MKTSPLKKPELRLVEIHGQKLMTTSLLVAMKFKKRHDNVLQKIDALIASNPDFGLLNFKETSGSDIQNKDQKFYEITESGFCMIAMRFTGKVAREWQIKFVTAFQEMRQMRSDSGREKAIIHKRDEALVMTDTLKFCRETIGKDTLPQHYSNEHLFCNRALTGEWKPVDENYLDSYDARLLALIRRRNSLLITRYPKQSDRRKLLDDFVLDYRAKHPKLTLVRVGGGV